MGTSVPATVVLASIASILLVVVMQVVNIITVSTWTSIIRVTSERLACGTSI